jgi:DnaJ family protein C protein 8
MESPKKISPEEEQKQKNAKIIIDRLLTFKDIALIDPFDILNISYNSTDEQIKRKYRSTAIQIHPDKCGLPQAGEAFHILENAYKFLLSSETKYNFLNLLSTAKERVNITRKEINDERQKKKLPLLPNDTIDDEIREMIRKINKENEDNEKYQRELKFSQKKRERDIEEKNKEDEIKKELRKKEWEGFRNKRVRNWNRFKDKASKKRNLYEIKARSYKFEEVNENNQITVYQEKSII